MDIEGGRSVSSYSPQTRRLKVMVSQFLHPLSTEIEGDGHRPVKQVQARKANFELKYPRKPHHRPPHFLSNSSVALEMSRSRSETLPLL
ncbi:hypothetical protein RRG08_053054 [Elysia crispata]|uniref:Uncharacterized protein n=1 Tax=Elysia crispata TaxID=231223 RepID=A0AAE0XSF1_9GAST|nr:hypothetical protein RRG08_053054 [Elysia crispata]